MMSSWNLRTLLVIIGTVASVAAMSAWFVHQAAAQSPPECPADWPGQGYGGALLESDHGRVQFEGLHTDADGKRWFVIRSSDSNGYTVVRAYPARSENDVAFDSPDRTCYLIVRRPGDSEDAAEPRQLIFAEEKPDPAPRQSSTPAGPAPSACTSEGAVDPGDTGLAADCEVLLDIRDTLSGTAPLNWGADVPIENWEGIDVAGTPPRVVQVWLSDRGMDGTVPSRLGELEALERLWLWNNDLSGAIPPELGNLSNLTQLWLNGNKLSGAIPGELGNLSNLTVLGLYENQLSGAIPVELGNLSNLTGLGMFGNQLGGAIPVELGNLSNLTQLSLSENQLSGAIPVELGNLSNLTQLSLSENQLSGAIPWSWATCPTLRNCR